MYWPADHPLRQDAALRPFAGGAAEVCPDGEVLDVLRYVPGRRVASLVTTSSGLGVLKVFARPRARGNHRRLCLLASSRAAGLVPRTRGTDRIGHVSLVDYTPGPVLDTVDDERFVAASSAVGAALATLHSSDVILDRAWTAADELAQLEKRMTPAVRTVLGPVPVGDRLAAQLGAAPLVASHRDCHPRQVVVLDDGTIRFIDLDDAARAPAGLDIGNFVAHLRREAVIGARSTAVADAAADALLCGYAAVANGLPADVTAWERLSLLRLVGLAETRHQRADWAEGLAALLDLRNAA